MKTLAEQDHIRFKAEREEIAAEVAEKLAGIDWNNLGLHERVMMREGWRAHVDECERRIADSVNRLRVTGESWAEIGKVLGISKQAAQQRYG